MDKLVKKIIFYKFVKIINKSQNFLRFLHFSHHLDQKYEMGFPPSKLEREIKEEAYIEGVHVQR